MDLELPDSDLRKGERLYKVAEKEADYYFGLEMELQFMFPAGGMNERGEELIAYFSGDDDLWVYIDNEFWSSTWAASIRQSTDRSIFPQVR